MDFIKQFKRVVERFGEETALTWKGENYTYREIDKKSDLVAGYLITHHLSCIHVGCAMQRSVLWYVALLGLLKARCSYTPLDLVNPKLRIQAIIQDAEIGFVITDETCAIAFDDVPSKTISDIINENIEADLPDISLDDIAYLFYTSGTTGHPKGVPATHRQLAMVPDYWIENVFHTAPKERVLQMAGLNFHVSLMESIAFLAGGTHVFMIAEEEKRDPQLLVDFLNKNKIERAFIAPAMLAVLPHVELPFLKTIVVAGEPCPKPVRDYWIQNHMIVNTYGSTETTVCIGSVVQTIEFPVNNVGPLNPLLEGVIVDENLQEVPDGTAGELCIGGPSVTSGYWKLPQQDAVKFIANKYSTISGNIQTLYRTGDYVRKDSTGAILHLGRIDDQVKIRGMRIETREIEMTLETHPSVEKAVVVAKAIKQEKRLIGYVKLQEDISTDVLKSYLSDLLPAFMCPSIFVKMQTFPVNINNKVMRNKLPDPVIEINPIDRGGWNNTEVRVTDILTDILCDSALSLDDTFLSLGGDSISAISFVEQLNKEFHSHISVREVLDGLTIKEIAASVDSIVKDVTTDDSYQSSDNFSDIFKLPQSLKDLWTSSQKTQESDSAYKMFFAFSFDSDTNIQTLEEAWNVVVSEQEAMRLTFINKGGELYGRLLPADYQEIPVSEINSEKYSEEIESFYTQTDLSLNEQLFKTKLFCLSDGSYRLCLVIHHLITDGLSHKILHQQILQRYQELLNGVTCSPVPVSYRRYLQWKVEQDRSDVEIKKAFWQEYLNQLPQANMLFSYDKQTCNVGHQRLSLQASDYKRLKLFCRNNQLTLSHTVLTIFGQVVGFFTNQTDFVIGVANTDRENPDFLHTAGYMVSMLPLRIRFSSEQSYCQLATDIKDAFAELRRCSMSLSSISTAAGLTSDRTLIDIAYAMENESTDMIMAENVVQNVPFALSLYVNQTEDDLTFTFQYDRRHFSDEAVESMASCFNRLLEQMLTTPDKPSGNYELTASPVKLPEPIDVPPTILHSFIQIATAHPQRIAYRCNSIDYSYGDVLEKSAVIASSVGHILFGKSTRNVGVCLTNKDLLIPVIISLFRQSACYVPIDSGLPSKRIQHIIDNAQLSIIISDTDICSQFDGIASIDVNDIVNSETASGDVDSTVLYPQAEMPAYIIFTSGSTGYPKGIPISHGSLSVFCQNFVELTSLQSGMRVLQFASLGFDASILEMFPALSVGATVVFPEVEQKTSPEKLLSFFEEEHITLSLIPPSLLTILPYRELPDLKTLLVGGESTPKDVQERWRKGRTLINAYGPTENTVMATSMTMNADTPYNNIGYPLPGVRCYVMDNNRRQLPDYAIGELYISGAQLTSGYLNNEEQNKLHFFSDPYHPQDRLYKSGDRVMRTKDGSFLFLGRVDDQVKIHGFRIEVSEIVKVLESLPDIRQAFVMVRSVGRDAGLYAYCICEEGSSVTEQEVIGQVSSILPHYMVPSVFMFVKEFPLNSNMKIDVGRLPRRMPEILDVPPSTMEESILEKIICEYLNKESVSVTADLFSEGLTSILAMGLTGVMEHQGLHYSYSDIYRSRTIRQLARLGQSKTWFWYNYAPAKPVVILVCGYTPAFPFYDDYIRLLSERYAVLVFDAFPVYFAMQPQKTVDADVYLDYMLSVVRQEISSRKKSVYAVTGHSLGSELGIVLAEKMRKEGNPDIRVLAIGTTLYRDEKIEAMIDDANLPLKQMLSTIPTLHFEGDLRVVLETRPSSAVVLNGEANAEFEELSKVHVIKNVELWKSSVPSAKLMLLNTSHFDLLNPDFLPQLIDFMDKNV